MIVHLFASIALYFDSCEARDAVLAQLGDSEAWTLRSSRDHARHSLHLSSESAVEGTRLLDHLGWLQQHTPIVEDLVQQGEVKDISVWVYLELGDLVNAGMSICPESAQWLTRLGAELVFDMYPASQEALR